MRARFNLDKRALFTDETPMYRCPSEPSPFDNVTIRFRTASDNVDSVYLVLEKSEIKMEKTGTESEFDYYECSVTMGEGLFSYYFEVNRGKETIYYNKLGPTMECKQLYAFHVLPGFQTPEWAKGAIFYQIYVDRFCNGEKGNDTLSDEYTYVGGKSRRVIDWDKCPEVLDVNYFYGGDLQGVYQKLDYLQQLGVEVIYFNPLFVSPSNHKYDIQDYDYIDPHFAIITKDEGELLAREDVDNRKATRYISRVTAKENLEASNAYFAKLVEEIHKRGMKVILDGVFNHCGSFNKWLDRERIYEGQEGYPPGAYVDQDSPYHQYFKFNHDAWPYNERYDGWWGHDTLPKLNYEESPELYAYIMEIARKWVSPPYNVDGWRLDVAADLGQSIAFNHKFWKDFRTVVKEANPEALILAEHYGDPTPWLEGDQWDSVMNYDAFMEPITWFLTGMEKHSDAKDDHLYGNGEWFFQTMAYNMSKFQWPAMQVAMNEISNHDHSRFLTRTNRVVGRIGTKGTGAASASVNKAILREAVLMQMTWPGAPTIYYGDEAGLVGWTDPDSRRTYPWGKEDWELIEFHRYMIQMHKEYVCLKRGSYKPLLSETHLIAYGRFVKEEKAVIIVNNRNQEATVRIPVWEIGVALQGQFTRVMQTNARGYNVGRVEVRAENGYLEIRMDPTSSMLLINKEGDAAMKFNDMPYERVNYDEVEKKFKEIIQEFQEAKSGEEQFEVHKKYYELMSEVTTNMTLAHIRHDANTTDEFYNAENDIYNEMRPKLSNLSNAYQKMMYDSPYRAVLEEKIGKVAFKNIEISLKSFDEKLIPLMQEENALTTAYSKLIAGAQIDWEGETLNLSLLRKYTTDQNRDTRKKAYAKQVAFFEENKAELDDLYDKLVKNRTEQARMLGYENYVELGYYRMGRNCYDKDMVEVFRKQVKEDMVPFAEKLHEERRKRLGVDKLACYDEDVSFVNGNPAPHGTPEEILANGQKMYSELSPETKEFYDFMMEGELFDVFGRKNKRAGGYMTYLEKYQAPFIFANFNGTSGDVDVITHECGHAFQGYLSGKDPIREHSDITMETAEIHSMSMEFFTSPWMELFMPDRADDYRMMQVEDAVFFIPYGTMVDEFQHIVYENPDMTPDERCAAWSKLEEEYKPHLDYTGFARYEMGGFWQKQQHIYSMPFYYIDYCLAQTCALQYKGKMDEDYKAAWESYLKLCKLSASGFFTDMIKEVGLKSPFEQGTLKSIIERLDK